MRTTKLSIEKNGVVGLQEQTTPIGYSGEHNVVEFVLSISEEVTAYFGTTEYFRFVINGWYSEPVYVKNNEIKYCLPQSCLTPPKINCQIIGYVISEGVPKEISKSAVFELEVGFSEGMQGQTDSAPNAMESALARCEQFEKSSADNSKSANEFADAAAASATIAQESAASSSQNAAKAEQVLSDMETAADSGRFDGFSPIAKVTATDGGAIISITDKSGTTEQPVYHGISPNLRRCFRFIGGLENKAQLPDSADIGEVYSVGGAKVYYNGPLSQYQIISTNMNSADTTSFDVYAKTDDYRCGGESVLQLVIGEPIGEGAIPGIPVSNFEGSNTLYLHFEIENGVATVTGEKVFCEGESNESRFAINQTMNLDYGDREIDFNLYSDIDEAGSAEAGTTLYVGPGFSKFVIYSGEPSVETTKLYVYDGSVWLPLSSAGGSTEGIEEALDAIIAIQESLIGGATE